MPIALPNLDDRTFADLTAELRSLIPRYDRNWTNHNPPDPGIMLTELFAWLGETVLYRMNRVPDRTYRAFLDLIGVQPAAAQAIITFEVHLAKDDLPSGFIIPRGCEVAARDELSGGELLFETSMQTPASAGHWDEDRGLWVFKAPVIHTVQVENEFLGVSDGRAGQEFSLRQPPVSLVIEDVLFEGNPKITVEKEGLSASWVYQQDLLDSVPADRHFTLARLDGIVRFGDGTRGMIPEKDSKITCTYRRIGGSRGNVGARQIKVLKDAVTVMHIDPSVVITVFNEQPAAGGVDGETLDELMASGLRMIQKQYRAVSIQDFEALAKEAAPGKIARVQVAPDRNLESTTPEAEGHVSLIVLLKSDEVAGQRATNREIMHYLDERRLITTILHVVAPTYTTLKIENTVQARPGANTGTVKEEVSAAITRFLDPHEGWEDGKGWPFGRAVYRSELYALIEGVKGVDYVEALTLNGDATSSAVLIGTQDLVSLEELKLTVL